MPGRLTQLGASSTVGRASHSRHNVRAVIAFQCCTRTACRGTEAKTDAMNHAGDRLDALVIGGGPAGLTAAIYLARFGRRFGVIDADESRAASIPESHNIPFFGDGIPGSSILARIRGHAGQYDISPLAASVTSLVREGTGFLAEARMKDGGTRSISARRILLATGSRDIEPRLPDLPDAVRRGLVRYCPICDGFESRDRRIAVIGHGARGLAEATFIARTYSNDVSLLSLGERLQLSPEDLKLAKRHGICLVEDAVVGLDVRDGRIAAMHTGGGTELRFDLLYSALGLHYRTELAAGLGAHLDDSGSLTVDEHGMTSVSGLYAAGDIVRGLDQIVVGMGQAAIAATHIHNHCELPLDGEV
ncbi:MAG: pyridine nucleotide-disulfide oxidoreductase [Rubritepida sp.]|nr:pyridine nucleotide-disulfide oxidoreductase [Rubritepida sp.]